MKIKEKIIPQRPYPILIILLNKALFLQETISSQTTSEEYHNKSPNSPINTKLNNIHKKYPTSVMSVDI